MVFNILIILKKKWKKTSRISLISSKRRNELSLFLSLLTIRSPVDLSSRIIYGRFIGFNFRIISGGGGFRERQARILPRDDVPAIALTVPGPGDQSPHSRLLRHLRSRHSRFPPFRMSFPPFIYFLYLPFRSLLFSSLHLVITTIHRASFNFTYILVIIILLLPIFIL